MGVDRQDIAVRTSVEDEWAQVVGGCGSGAFPYLK
jgi:hypothetical protein